MSSDPDIESLKVNQAQIWLELRHMQKQIDTLGTPLYKRIFFRLDGWPRWWIVSPQPKWRPWRKWFKS